MPPISVMIKPASGMCNMHCDYCFYSDGAAKRTQASYGFMSDTTLKNVIRRTVIPAEDNCSIVFQGGEPTLCGLPFFEKAVAYAKQYRRGNTQLHFALQTNGYGMTDEFAEFFAENRFLVGVSVDGIEAVHNRYRHGPGEKETFAQVLDGIRMLEEHNADFNILTVVHREVAEHIREIYPFYRQHGWDYMQFITCLDPLGEPRGGITWSLTPETYGMFLTELFDLWYADWQKGNAPYIRQFENYVGILLGHTPESCEQRGICSLQYVVEADGSVYPCDFYVLDEWKLGNFNEERLESINERFAKTGFLARSYRLPEKCAACPWKTLCRGGCCRSRMTEEEPDTGLNYFCEGYRRFFESCADRLKHVAETVRHKQSGG